MKNQPILLGGGAMRSVENAAMAAGEARGIELMERAGQGVVDAILATWPELAGTAQGRALILCGPGNNGGDGFVVARLLHGLGWTIDLRLLGDPDRLPADAAENFRRWRDLGEIRPILPSDDGAEMAAGADLLVDSLFGTGLTRPLSVELAGMLSAAIAAARRSVAVDLLSGLCADSGRMLGERPFSPVDLAVTFQTRKPGHLLATGAEAMGEVSVVDIGLAERAAEACAAGMPGAIRSLETPECAAPTARKAGGGHKYNHGHAVVLSGGAAHTGAARLAARGALRMGAGLVTLAVPPAAQMEVACHVTAIMLRRVADAADLTEMLGDHRYNALCLGPGLGVGERCRAMVLAALEADRATVLDADALTSFKEAPEMLFAATRGRNVVMTPHDGEFGRLFPEAAERTRQPADTGPAWSRIDAVRWAADRAGCTVLLKGAVTLVAAPGGKCAMHDALRSRPAPWLATAGAGDVLAGMITGLLARGAGPFEAAGQAAWLHVEAARHFGPGLIAEDLPEQLPAVLRGLT